MRCCASILGSRSKHIGGMPVEIPVTVMRWTRRLE